VQKHFDQPFDRLGLIVVMKRNLALFDRKVRQQIAGMPGIFRSNDINTLQSPSRARRQVFEITDGCCNDEQRSSSQ
jgi:hypothetical protein